MPTTQESLVVVPEAGPVLWCFAVMLGGFTFCVFLNAAAYVASGKPFSDFFHRS